MFGTINLPFLQLAWPRLLWGAGANLAVALSLPVAGLAMADVAIAKLAVLWQWPTQQCNVVA